MPSFHWTPHTMCIYDSSAQPQSWSFEDVTLKQFKCHTCRCDILFIHYIMQILKSMSVCVCKSFLCYVFFSVCLFLKCARKTKITSFFIFYQIMVFKWIFVNLNTWFYFLQDQLPSSSCKHSLRRKSEANEHKLKSHVIIYQVLCQTKEK